MARTKVTGGLISTTSNYEVGVITATKFVGPFEGTTATFTGDVDIQGTLSYIDVDNINSTGIITAQDYVNIGAGLSVAGVSTFTSSVGIADSIIHLGNTDTSIRFPTDDTFTVETAGSERLRITSDGYLKLAGTISGSNNKLGRFLMPSHDSSEEDVMYMQMQQENTFNQLEFGGGSSSYNAATRILFRTAAIDTVTGVERLRINSTGQVGICTQTIPSDAAVHIGLDGDREYLRLDGDTSNNNAYIELQADDNRRKAIIFKSGGTRRACLGVGDNDEGNATKLFLSANDSLGGNNAHLIIESGGQIGIKHQTPSTQYFNTLVVGDDSVGDKGITIRTTSSDKGVLAFSDTDTADANRYDGWIGYLHRDQRMVFNTGGANHAMSIDSSRNIGIGVTNPIKHLDVRGTGYQGILIGSTDNQGAQLVIDGIGGGDAAGGNYSALEVPTSGHLTIRNFDTDKDIILGTGSQTGANDTVVITDDQKVGIGTDDPDYGLHVHGAGDILIEDHGNGSAHLRLRSCNNGTDVSNWKIKTGSDNHLYIENDTAGGASQVTFDPDANLSIRGEYAAALDYPNFRPTVDWNFAAVKKLDSRLTYQRTGPASYIDELGIVKLVGNNTPRFDHDPVTRECKGLLIEPSRTNLIPNSFDKGTWATGSGGNTVTRNAGTAPDGTETATKVLSASNDIDVNTQLGNASAGATGQISISGGTTYTLSIWAKASTTAQVGNNFKVRWKRVQGDSTFSENEFALTANWTRYSTTATTAANNSTVACYIGGVSGSEALVWGAQFEAGAYATSLIPTHGQSVTRGIDLAYLDGTAGTEFDDIYRTDEGTFVLDWFNDPNGNHNDGYVFTIDDGTGNNRIGAVNSNGYQLTVTEDNASQGNRDLGSINSGDNKMAFTYKYNDQATSLNGSDASVDTVCTIPTSVLKYWWIGLRQGQYDMLGGYVKRIVYYPTRLPNNQLKTLSS